MTKSLRHALLLLLAICMVAACERNYIESDTLGTEGITQGKLAYDTIQSMRDLDPGPNGDTLSVKQAFQKGLTLASGETSKEFYYIIGYVKGFSSDESKEKFQTDFPTYGNRYPIIWDKNGDSHMLCYRLMNYYTDKFTDLDQLQIGDVVVIRGHIQNYNNAPQVASGFLVTSNNPGNIRPELLVDLRDATNDTITVDKAISIGLELPSGSSDASKTPRKYYILGFVKGFSTDESKDNFASGFETYGNRYPILTNKNGDSFMLCYRLLGINNKKFTSLDQLKVGDQVVVYGQIQNYSNSPQVTQGGYLVTSDNPLSGYKPEPIVAFAESFNDGLGAFTIDNKLLPDGVEIWKHVPQDGQTQGFINANSDKQKVNAESWLVSPTIDFTKCPRGVVLSFNHYCQGKAADASVRPDHARVLVSKDDGATWEQITIPDDMWNKIALKRFVSVSLDLTQYSSKTGKIAFAYKSTESNALWWAIQNVRVGEPLDEETEE